MGLSKDLEVLGEQYSAMVLSPADKLQEHVNDVMQYLTKSKAAGVYVSLNKPEPKIKGILQENNVDTSKVFFVDCIASKQGKTEITQDVLHIDDPTDLKLLDDSVKSYLEAIPGEKYLVIDALSTLLIYNNRENVAKFVKSVTEHAVEYKTKVVMLSPKTGDKELLTYIFNFYDKVLEKD
jgi:hypothetical protein